ncbi:hypothetical protein K8I28_16010 [bacterium]|nr:hypothetical protein [bacterium]
MKNQFVCILILLLLLPSLLFAQSWGSSTGLLQGERIAQVSSIFSDTVKATNDTTSWIAFGTHVSSLASERVYAPTRFTLFLRADTTDVPHNADPSISLKAELALNDTTEVIYEQYDQSLQLIPTGMPLTTTTGQAIPVPIYGGGWLRFIVTSADSAYVDMHLWRTR